MGKALLPWFGGTPLVWTTCMMFFQAILLLGYAYAHLIINTLRPKHQWLVHLSFLFLGLFFAELLPGPEYAPTGDTPPARHLLWILTVHVSLPFFVLSGTAPLVQVWFKERFPTRSPYPLYAVSNAGSLLGVLSYPFVVEPLFTLSTQSAVWRWGYLLFAAGLGTAGYLTVRVVGRRQASAGPELPPAPADVELEDPPADRTMFKWISLSLCGSVLLLATTDQISQDVAASPLFWVVPLCLYLLSFILCFAEERLYHRALWLSLLPVAVVAVCALLFLGGGWPVSVQLGIYAATLFIGCMTAHGELARLKPATDRLSRYYLAVSIGGVLGGLFVAVVSPLLFPDMWEYTLGWIALYTVVIKQRYAEAGFAFFKGRARLFWILFGAGWLAAAALFVTDVIFDHREAFVMRRSFFGRVAVYENRQKRCLYHGRIRHGCQWSDPNRAMDATTYYGPDSGINIAYHLYKAQHPKIPLRIGVIGLGIGTAAIFGDKGDTLRFFELDEEVVTVANRYFTYLKGAAAHTDVVTGDGRLSLEREKRDNVPRYDILVLDAFAGDAVPLHLLTREAFALYWNRLKPNGVLVANISNRHVRLEPLMLGLAGAFEKKVVLVEGKDDWGNMFYCNSWIIMTQNDGILDRIAEDGLDTPWPEKRSTPILFEDHYSNLLALF